MRKLVVLLSIMLSLSSCSYLYVHKMDIEQGNVLTPEMLHQIHAGMSVEDVKNIAGSPVLSNVFDAQRVDYVYAYNPGYGKSAENYVTLIFKNGHVSEVKGNMYSQFIK